MSAPDIKQLSLNGVADGQFVKRVGTTFVGASLAASTSYPADGRLTGISGDPIGDAAGIVASIYYTPFIGNQIALYDGANWQTIVFTEKTLSLASISANLNYDVFGFLNAGDLALELSAAWTGDNVRGPATGITRQDGIWVKTGDATRRYLGTIRGFINGAIIDGGSLGNRFLWNYYNRRPIQVFSKAANSWSPTSSSWAQIALGNSVHKFVVGLAEDAIASTMSVSAFGVGFTFGVTFGFNSSSPSDGATADRIQLQTTLTVATAHFYGLPLLGYNFLDGLYSVSSSGPSAGGDNEYNRMTSLFWR